MNRRQFLKTTALGLCGLSLHIPMIEQEKVHPFIRFAEENFKINHYKHGIIPFKATKHQKELANIYDDNRFIMVKHYRQGGFSTFSALWAVHQCLTKVDNNIIIFTAGDRAALKVKEIIDCVTYDFPERIARNRSYQIEFNTGSKIYCFSGNEAIRGFRTHCIIMDDAAFFANLRLSYMAFYPMISTCKTDKLIMVSGPNGKNYFHKLWTESNFYKYSPSYKEHPRYQDEEFVKNLRNNLGEKGWRQEIEAEFI